MSEDFSAGSFDKNALQSRGFATVQHGNDQSLGVRFRIEAVEQPFKSVQAGRPIFEDVEFIEIHQPGGKTVIDRPADNEDRNRFGRQYEAFKRRETQTMTGTPIEHWPVIKTSQVHELKALGIFSVEQIAAISDSQGMAIGMGWRSLKTQAQAFLDCANDSAAAQKLAVERDELKAETDHMKALINALSTEVAALKSGKKTVADTGELSHNVDQESVAVLQPSPIPSPASNTFANISEQNPYQRRGRPKKEI